MVVHRRPARSHTPSPVFRSGPFTLALGFAWTLLLAATGGSAPDEAAAATPNPAVHRSQRDDDGRWRRAPKSLAYIYGEEKESRDPETEEGGDGGTNSGGEGTGDALEPAPRLGDITGFDGSADDPFARISPYNALTLEDPGFGTGSLARRANQALCFCVDTAQPGWATAPGYGNDWDMRAVWQHPVPSASAPATVRVRFVANHDLEPAADVFRLEVARDGGAAWEVLRTLSGRNGGPTAPGPTVVDETFTVLPADYVGPASDRVRLRLRVLSDRIGSDEDGLWPSDGAAQVDEVRVWIDGTLVSLADFETTGSGADGWTPQAVQPAGDFLKLLKLTTDLDPCRRNLTYQFSFVDDGTPPSNDPTGGGTGGAVSPTWTYGPDGYVVNYTGGISGGATPLRNSLRTRPFAWDLPGPDDDGLWGGQLEFSVFRHLPLENGMFYFWSVRSYGAAGWTSWRDFGDVYYEPALPHYDRAILDVSSLLVAQPESVQVELGVVDLADALGLPGDDATPSPMFDNIAFAKFALDGPVIEVRDDLRLQDSFPPSGAFDYDADPAALALRLDAARDIAPGPAIVPGDSMVVTVRSLLPGSALQGPPVLRVALLANPRFDGLRTVPTGWMTLGTQPGPCGGDTRTLYVGEVVGEQVRTVTGEILPGRWFFDLPDGPARPGAGWQTNEPALFFPGDELRWMVRATDDLGNTSTWPANTTGFLDFGGTSVWTETVRGLPSLRGTDPLGAFEQPAVLVLDDTGDRARSETIESALRQIGYPVGCGVDLYRVQAAGSGVGNGIGSAGAHGATVDQLLGYTTVVAFFGEQANFLLSDGSGPPLHDDGDDLGTLQNWRVAVGSGRFAWFGDNFVSGMLAMGKSSFVELSLGAQLLGADVRDHVDGQVAPTVAALSGAFPTTGWVAGACLSSDQFDAITPATAGLGAQTVHEFLTPGGAGGAYPVAAALYSGDYSLNTVSVHLTVPISFSAILDPVARDASGLPLRARLLGDILAWYGGPVGVPTDVPGRTPPSRARLEGNTPNPFNPRTEITFALPTRERVRIEVVDLAGRRVRTLLDEARPAGRHAVTWDGRDERGSEVASGVYLVHLRAGDDSSRRKVALVR